MGEIMRERLLSCGKETGKFCEFISSLKAEYNVTFGAFEKGGGKKLIAAASEIVQELNRKQVELLWCDLANCCLEAAERLFKSVEAENEKEDDQMETEGSSPVEVLEAISIMLLASVRLEEPTATNGMFQCAQILHGLLFDLCDENPLLASSICTICVAWFNKKLPSHEQLCLNAITFLLRDFLRRGERRKLQMIRSMQGCLSLFEFKRQATRQPTVDQDDVTFAESVVQELKDMLISCFQHPEFLSDSGGRKFLSSVLLLHTDFMKDIHRGLMVAIVHKFSLLKAEALGNVYFQSWKTAEEEVKSLFEENCIQDLMFRTAHAPRAKDQNSFVPLRTMLFSIVCHKTSLEVRHMIARLYAPILWRSLKANNSMVRANASTLLLDAFPMEDNEAGRLRTAESEEFMQRQYSAMNSMLMDDCPRIRIIGIVGLCEVLHMFWDAMPAHIIAILSKTLYNELAFDATVEVRQAVFKGTITLLDTPCAHPLLTKLLPPCMDKCIHDVSEKVRIAVADALLAVKRTSTIAFWVACPIPNIIAQLEIDGVPVSKRLVKLLFRSFIPEGDPVQTWVERCVDFFQRNINAARKFYEFADKDLTVQEIAEFLNMIGIFIFNCVSRMLGQQSSAEDPSADQTDDDLNSTQLNSATLGHDSLTGLLDTSCIMWKSIDQRAGARDREAVKKIMITFSRTIHACFKMATDERMLNALYLLSSKLPPSSLPVFSTSILPKLRSLDDDAPSSHYEMLIKCICSWNWTNKFLELVSDWLIGVTDEFGDTNTKGDGKADGSVHKMTRRSSALRRASKASGSLTQIENEVQASSKSAATKRKKKVVTFTGVQEQPRPGQALKYLRAFLLVQSSNFFPAVDKGSCLALLMTISKSLEKCQVEIFRRLSPSSSASKPDQVTWSDGLLVEAVSCRFQLIAIIHLQQKSKGTDGSSFAPTVPLEEFRSTTDWFCEMVKGHESATEAQANLNSSLVCNEATSTGLLSRLSFYRQVFNCALDAFLDYLSCGIDVFDEVESAILLFCSSEMNFVEYVVSIMEILLQLHEHKLLTFCTREKGAEEAMAEEDQAVDEKINVKIVNIFDHVLSTLLQHARRSPDSFTQLCRQNMKQLFRTLVKEQHLVQAIHPDKVWYDDLIKKAVSAVLADLSHEIRSSRHVSYQTRVPELPSFSAFLLPVICATSQETAYVCQNAVLPLAGEGAGESRDQMLLALALLMRVLIQDGKNKAIAEACVSTMCQDVPGFDDALSALKAGMCQGESLSADRKEDGEEIVVLENPEQEHTLMDDEKEFFL